MKVQQLRSEIVFERHAGRGEQSGLLTRPDRDGKRFFWLTPRKRDEATLQSLQNSRALFAVSVSGIDPVIAAPVQAQHDYSWRDVRFANASSISYTQFGRGQLTVDCGRLDHTGSAE